MASTSGIPYGTVESSALSKQNTVFPQPDRIIINKNGTVIEDARKWTALGAD